MSKGVEIIGEIVEERGEGWCPPSWYTCSMDLKKCIARAVVERWDEDVHLIMRLPLLCQAEIIKNVYVNSIEIDGRKFVVGLGGKFAKDKLLIRHGEIYDARMESFRRAVNYLGA